MRHFIKIVLAALLFLSLNSFAQSTGRLYPFQKGKLYGYMDASGKTVIKPQFLSAKGFSEGLAAVRLKGTYGYIDLAGTFVIAPVYDLALPFDEGFAKVFIDGKPFFIDPKGKILFQHRYESISAFENHTFASVVTASGKCGLIDRSGKLIVDTVFASLDAFPHGVFIVTSLHHEPYPRGENEKPVFETAVIDSLGNWLVNYGRYKAIGAFKGGYSKVELFVENRKGYTNHEGMIDETGTYRFTVPAKTWRFSYNDEGFHEGLANVAIYSVDPDTVKVWGSYMHYDYCGVVNAKGEIVCSNPDWYELTPFTGNRAFAKDKKAQWWLVDRKGKVLSSQSYDKILYDAYSKDVEQLFENGKAFVRTEKGWGAIDSTGKYVIEPHALKQVDFDHVYRNGDVLLLEEDISVENKRYAYRYGFWNTNNNAIVKPRFHYMNDGGFRDGVVLVATNEKGSYIDASGKLLKQEHNAKAKGKLNIDHMNRGYYYASSKYKQELGGFGGWGSSENRSKPLAPGSEFLPGKLQVLIKPQQKTTWAEDYDAVKLFVANTSADTLYFEAQDSRLYLNIQALDRNGEWKDIEYLPSSWCGNSYHSLFLAPNEGWDFATPVYEGEFKTKLRAKLLYKKSMEQETDEVLYSNEMEGSINPGQFWNKREYYRQGLMDPYND